MLAVEEKSECLEMLSFPASTATRHLYVYAGGGLEKYFVTELPAFSMAWGKRNRGRRREYLAQLYAILNS
jgi:hypothetical protein